MKQTALLLLAGVLAALWPASAAAKNPVVIIETSMGNIKVELFEDKAPKTVKNFLDYVDAQHYDGTIFHRVMGKENTPNKKDFMIQGGGFEPGLRKKRTRDPVKSEADNKVSNVRGTIAMARLDGKPDSATNQFFINVGDNKALDKENDGDGYTAFGKVIEGMDVVDKIKAVKTATRIENIEIGGKLIMHEHKNCPAENIIIKSIKRDEKK